MGPPGSSSGGGGGGSEYILNVKDFGAVGDGTADDTAAIQATFDAAFGPASAPHGNGMGHTNKPVYFPAGIYRTTAPLVVTAVWGGKIFGDGPLCSTITYQGPIAPVNAEGWCPVLWANGINLSLIEGLRFKGPPDPANFSTVGIWVGPQTSSGGGSSATNNLFQQVWTETASNGLILGSTDSAANSENTYIACTFTQHGQYGVFVSGGNTLNHKFIGGGITFCDIAGIKTNNSATTPVLIDVSFDHNAVDCDFAASSYCSLIGCRTEGAAFVKASSNIVMQSCQQQMQGGTFTGSMSGTTLTVSGGVTGQGVYAGMAVYGGSLPVNPPLRVVKMLSGTAMSGTFQMSASATQGSTTLTCRPVFLDQPGASTATLTNCFSAYDPVLISGNNSVVRIEHNGFYDQVHGVASPDLLKWYQGQILAYDVAWWGAGGFTVAHLPAPIVPLKGVRMFVTDSSVTTWGTTVAAGGGSAVPVWCDGTAWKVG